MPPISKRIFSKYTAPAPFFRLAQQLSPIQHLTKSRLAENFGARSMDEKGSVYKFYTLYKY